MPRCTKNIRTDCSKLSQMNKRCGDINLRPSWRPQTQLKLIREGEKLKFLAFLSILVLTNQNKIMIVDLSHIYTSLFPSIQWPSHLCRNSSCVWNIPAAPTRLLYKSKLKLKSAQGRLIYSSRKSLNLINDFLFTFWPHSNNN